MKLLHEIIGHMPQEVERECPQVSIEEYWKINNGFLNMYDQKGKIVLLYRCKFLHRKMKVYVDDFKYYAYVKRSEYLQISQEDRIYAQKFFNLEIEISGIYFKIFIEDLSINTKFSNEKDDKLRFKDFLKHRGVEFLESDISPAKRFSIDNDIKIADNFTYLFFDIETDDRQDGIVIGRDRILSCAGVDQDGHEYFYILETDSDVSEKKLIDQIYNLLNSYDIVIGWNSKNFDIEYIRLRYKLYNGYFPKLRDIAHIDFMERFKEVFNNDIKIRQWSLNYISNYFLQDQKIQVKMGDGGSYDMWENNKVLLKEYNLKDCQLLCDLEKKLKVLDLIIKMCQWVGSPPSRFYRSEVLDNYILRFAKQEGVHFKSVDYSKDKAKENITGGFVLEPRTGLHNDVYCFDFAGLYPSIIRSWNISPEVLVIEKPENENNYIKTANGYWMKKDKIGIMPKVIEKLTIERAKYKKLKSHSIEGSTEYSSAHSTQLMIKELSNSCYGVCAQQGGRYYQKEMAESITMAGRYLVQYTKKLLEESLGYTAVMSDTDSVYFTTNGQLMNSTEILPWLNNCYKDILYSEFNVDESYLNMEYEKKYKRFLMIAKKNYAGRLCMKDDKEVDEFHVKGLEYVKRNTIECTKKFQGDMIKKIVYENKSCLYYIDFIRKIKKSFIAGEINIDDMITRIKISKPIKDYKSNLIHVNIARQMVEDQKHFHVGMVIPYIVTNGNSPLQGVHMDDFTGSYDRSFYWNHKIFPPLERVLKVVYPKFDWSTFKIKKMKRKRIKKPKTKGLT